MSFLPTILSDAFVIEPERLRDTGGFLARTWCQEETAGHALQVTVFADPDPQYPDFTP